MCKGWMRSPAMSAEGHYWSGCVSGCGRILADKDRHIEITNITFSGFRTAIYNDVETVHIQLLPIHIILNCFWHETDKYLT